MNITKQTIFRYAENISFIALCIAIANATFFGTANYAVELGFSVWSIVVPVMLLGSLGLLICNIKSILKNPTLWILVAYGIWIVISAIRGYQAGNSIGNVMDDLQRVICFALFPVLLTILNNESRITKLMKIVVYSSLALSILTIVFLFSYVVWPTFFDKLLHLGYYGQFVSFTKISDTIGRTLFVSSPMQLFGCVFALYYLATDRQRKIGYSVIIGLNLFCILMSLTRTLYLAAFVAAFLAILLVSLTAERKPRMLLINRIAVSVLTCVVMVVSFSLVAKTNYFGYALQRVFVNYIQEETPSTDSSSEETSSVGSSSEETSSIGSSSEESSQPDEMIDFKNEDEYLQATLLSDNIRENIKKMLRKHIDTDPIFGVGLGMRLPNRNTPPEFFYLDLWAKTGIIGLLFFLIPIGLVIVDILKRIIRRQPFLISAIWCVGLIGLMVYSVLQPYMNTAPCILMYCCVLCVNSWQKKHINEQRELDC